MIFENYQEYNELISEISKSLKSTKRLEAKQDEIPEDESIGGDVPLDEVLPPSKGHSVGPRTPTNSSQGQPYHGGPWLEHSLEERLCSLLEEIGANDQSDNAQRDAGQGKVGVTAVLGHGTGKPDDPRTPLRDDYAKIKVANKDAKDAKEEEGDASEEMEQAAKSLGLTTEDVQEFLDKPR